LQQEFLEKFYYLGARQGACKEYNSLKVLHLGGAGKTTYILSAHFCYGNGYLASYPDL